MKISPIGKDQESRSFPDHNTSSFFDSKFEPSSSIGTLSGPEFLWGSPTTYSDHQSNSWHASLVGPFSPSQHDAFFGPPHHLVGSALVGIPLDMSERSFMSPVMHNGSHMGSFGKGQMMFSNGSYQGRGGLNDGLMVGNRTQRVDCSVNQIGNEKRVFLCAEL
ncbi:unnamed protein product [Lactuca virosa]|uniref:Uncharacterized protein n=1 Tax=Lactuca virosa TaxID=75947 RepID=A0AAU9MWX0_9ASTR|nr:unnamed protein product [Lactuca virosa]